MVMLSILRRFALQDGRGQRARVVDFVLGSLDDDHPAVTGLRFRHPTDGREWALAWDRLKSIDWPGQRFHVASFDEAGPVPETADSAQSPAKGVAEVLLRRDILDALVLDLENRRATRANDLELHFEDEDRSLRLVGVDFSVVAVLRRLSRGRVGRRLVRSKIHDWKYVEFLRGDPAAVGAGAGYQRRITRLPAGEIARLVDALPYLHAAELLTLLPDPLAADTLEAMSAQRQLQVFEELSQDQGCALLALMAPDLAADLVGRLHTEDARKFLDCLGPEHSARIVELLRYPEDTVGSMMTNDVLSVPVSFTVGEARETLRERLREPDFISFIYAVDDEKDRRLRGVVTLRKLITSEESARIADVMNPYVVTIHALDHARAAAHRVLNSHLVALPVVGREGRLLGAVTIDGAVMLVAPSRWSAQAPRIFS